MLKVVEVFTPNDVPTFTYVDRPTHKLEQRLEQAFQIPKMIISISGPSKSGKTVLVNKVIEKDNLIPLSGASIRTADELWSKVLGWMESPITISEKDASAVKGEITLKAGGKTGIPFVAEGKAEGAGRLSCVATWIVVGWSVIRSARSRRHAWIVSSRRLMMDHTQWCACWRAASGLASEA